MSSTTTKVSDTYMNYMRNLGLGSMGLGVLKSKKILDIGAEYGDFARDLFSELGGDVDITSIDNRPGKSNYKVQAMNTKKLHFENETFDIVVSHCAIPNMLGRKDSIADVFMEILRVVKPGGKVIFAPVIWKAAEEDYRPEKFKGAFEQIKRLGFQVIIDKLDEKSVRATINVPNF